MSDRRNKREKEQLFNMPEIAKLEKKTFSGAMEKLEDSKLKKVLIWVFEITVTLIFAVLTSMMLFQSVTMQESSMEPTLAVGSRYFVNKLAYKASSPKRGDLIVFRTNASDDAALHIRRVIGLPGETVEIRDGKVYINGSDEPLDDSFVPEVPTGNYGPYTVPENSYFMLGDNREYSRDSRFWKNTFVSFDEIVGKAIVRYYPSIKLLK